MLNGVRYTNNSYIPITDIGRGEDDSLLCVTDNTACCNTPFRAGEWYYPNGSAVRREGEGDDLFRDRRLRVVRLNRRSASSTPTTGLYRCEIPGSSAEIKTLLVNIYRDCKIIL